MREFDAAVLFLVTIALAIVVSADARAANWVPDVLLTPIGNGAESWSAGFQWDWNREWQWGHSLMLRGRWEFAVGRWRAELAEHGSDWALITRLTAAPLLSVGLPDLVAALGRKFQTSSFPAERKPARNGNRLNFRSLTIAQAQTLWRTP